MKLRLALMFEMRPPIADATDVRAFQYVGIGELVMDKGSKSFKGTISALPPVELALAVNTDESVRPKPGSSLSTRMFRPSPCSFRSLQ